MYKYYVINSKGSIEEFTTLLEAKRYILATQESSPAGLLFRIIFGQDVDIELDTHEVTFKASHEDETDSWY